MGYSSRAIRGFSWIWALRFVTRSLSFLRIAAIARLLSPTLFGFYGIAALVLSFIEVFTESGINIFIIQEKENVKKIINTAWVVSIARGVVIFLIILLSAPFISGFFDAPESSRLIYMISFVPLIRGFINPSIIKFQKDLEFKKEFFFRGFIFIIESISAVVFVYMFRDPAGIIYGLIIGAIIEVVISFIFVKPVPVFSIDKEKIARIFSRGKWITAGGIFNYLYHNADDAIVGRILGASSLGIYDMAYRISMLPITEVGETVSKVIFPVYTKFSDDNARLKRAFIKTMLGISVFTLPIGAIFFIFAEQIIFIVLGEQWLSAVPVFRALAIFGVLRTFLNPIFSIYLAVKKQEYNTFVSFVSFAVMIVSIVPLMSRFGLLGAGIAVVVGLLVSMPIAFYLLMRIFNRESSTS